MFVLTRGYYENIKLWLDGRINQEPKAPTSYNLLTDYSYLLQNKMISDQVILHPVKFKFLFGEKAIPQLQASIKIIKSNNRLMTSNQIKTAVVTAVKEYFDIEYMDFGKTFFFSELASYVHAKLVNNIDSIVLVPKFAKNVFGDMYQVFATDDEIIQPSITVDDIILVESLNPDVLRQNV
jgi:hypothetical protein